MLGLRPLQNKAFRLVNQMNKTKPLTRRPSLLLPPSQASFGGMMGMGELADILAGKCDPNDAIKLWEMEDRVGILLTLEDKPGILNDAL